VPPASRCKTRDTSSALVGRRAGRWLDCVPSLREEQRATLTKADAPVIANTRSLEPKRSIQHNEHFKGSLFSRLSSSCTYTNSVTFGESHRVITPLILQPVRADTPTLWDPGPIPGAGERRYMATWRHNAAVTRRPSHAVAESLVAKAIRLAHRHNREHRYEQLVLPNKHSSLPVLLRKGKALIHHASHVDTSSSCIGWAAVGCHHDGSAWITRHEQTAARSKRYLEESQFTVRTKPSLKLGIIHSLNSHFTLGLLRGCL
jgi:hypothetical protein